MDPDPDPDQETDLQKKQTNAKINCICYSLFFTNSSVLISNRTIAFQNCCPKILTSGIFFPKFKDFTFTRKLALGKFEIADFKYDNIFSKLQSKNTKQRHFWSQI